MVKSVGMNRATLLILVTLVILAATVVVAIQLARGYQFDLSNRNLFPTGILVATSDPDGAEVLINGKLASATNTTLNLAPGNYDIMIQKDGFTSWDKKVEIKKEEVFKTNAFLFPKVPDLRPLTLTGAYNPAISPDGTKIAFGVASASAERNGIWITDMGQSFLPSNFFNPGLRLIFKSDGSLPLTKLQYLWSPDNRQVLAYTSDHTPTSATPSAQATYMFLTDRLNDGPTIETPIDAANLLSGWNDLDNANRANQMARIDQRLSNFLATNAAQIKFSPDETKILYRATASATLQTILGAYLPGTNPTPETRTITPGNLYVYDAKEDKNYLIQNPTNTTVVWFPSSRHLLEYSDKEIAVVEFDGTNRAIVYAGPFVPGIVYPWPNWSKIVIETSLNGPGVGLNLYTINLR